jgi:hypothetical protein
MPFGETGPRHAIPRRVYSGSHTLEGTGWAVQTWDALSAFPVWRLIALHLKLEHKQVVVAGWPARGLHARTGPAQVPLEQVP